MVETAVGAWLLLMVVVYVLVIGAARAAWEEDQAEQGEGSRPE
jgi:hypothetical protein